MTPDLGWLHIISDLGVSGAYLAIASALSIFVLRKQDLPFRAVFWLFAAFALASGATNLMEAAVFLWPADRLSILLKLVTAIMSWALVALMSLSSRATAMRSPQKLKWQPAILVGPTGGGGGLRMLDRGSWIGMAGSRRDGAGDAFPQGLPAGAEDEAPFSPISGRLRLAGRGPRGSGAGDSPPAPIPRHPVHPVRHRGTPQRRRAAAVGATSSECRCRPVRLP